ncbi:Imm1 family immunity protein [Streptomyces sp. NPDC007020]|uniref:Imm1 family immunity protein n=1 Tax=Streptomyces sp. NPDC007020 TaxID=3154585 RepID=UPI0033D7F1F6
MGSETEMTLKVLGNVPLYLKSQIEVDSYLDEVFTAGARSNPYADLAFQIVKDVAGDRAYAPAPDNILSVGIDFAAGYGGLIWYCDGDLSRQVSAEFGHDIAYYPWVSLNPDPPQNDPRVMSDPSCPTFFDRVSAIPLPVIRAVVEEYYHAGTGFRPAKVQWAKGHYTGELDTEVTEA